MNATPNNPNNALDPDSPLEDLMAAATAAKNKLGLKYFPVVIRSETTAFEIAARNEVATVMLGDGAYWVVCLADAARLEKAGYEFAPGR